MLYVPARHLVHPSSDCTAVALLCVPAGHAIQADMPAVSWYCPSGHGKQRLALAAPGLARNVPFGHGRHCWSDTMPRSSLYLPTGHAVQLAAEVEPGAEPYLPASHARQLSCSPSAERFDHVPAGHCVQVVALAEVGTDPVPSLKVPGGHARQAAASLI